MTRANRRRWRDTRDSLPARRRRRRTHRRDKKRGGTYYPIAVDAEVARRGVRTRLLGALVAVTVTTACAIFAILSALSTFGAMFALGVGASSLGAAVALLLSARQEEQVHAFAAELGDDPAARAALPGGYARRADGPGGAERGPHLLMAGSLPAPPHASPGALAMANPCCYRAQLEGGYGQRCLDQTDGAV